MQSHDLSQFQSEQSSHIIHQCHTYKDQQADRSSHNFTVAARIKPRDIDEPNFKVVINKNHKEIHIESNKSLKGSYTSKSKNFKMNSIFPQQSCNTLVFNQLVQPKLALLKNNCNVAVMAYGATNSGKTHTIFGSQPLCPQNKGLAYLCGDHLINNLFKDNYKFYFSYLEIYNENIQDLLSEKDDKKHYLNIFEDHNGKINIPDLTKVQIESYEHLEELIEKGNATRAEASNHLNQRSSRSHALLQIDIFSIQDPTNPVILTPIDVNFMIIDLAGSEKSSLYLQQGHQSLLKEGGNINRSLLALGNCITNLSNGQIHIPYRDSKLTRILKDNLSGYCHNIMIACISQNMSQYEETINTLQYASKAYKIQNYASNHIKNRSQYVQIPCEHCHMTMQFAYLSKILKHYSYQIIDSLDQGPLLCPNKSDSKMLKKIEERSKRKRKRDRSASNKKQDSKVNKKNSVSADKVAQSHTHKQTSLKLNYKKQVANNIQQKKSKSHERLALKIPFKKEQNNLKDLHINVWEDSKNYTQKSFPSQIKLSINSKKEDSQLNVCQEEHSVYPFMEEENFDLSELYSKTSNQPKEQPIKYESTFRAVLKRNSQPRSINLVNKQNDFNYINIQEEEGSKTTRDQPNSIVETQNTSSTFLKAAKRMKPDTLEPLIRSLSPEPIIVEKNKKQRIKIVPKLR